MKLTLKALAMGLILIGTQIPTQAQILLSYFNFNNTSTAYNAGTGTLGSLSSTAASYGEQYATASGTYTLSSNTANGTVYNSSAVKLDLTDYTTISGSITVNGLLNGTGARQQTSTSNPGFATYAESGVNAAATDTTTGTGDSLIIMNPGSKASGLYMTLTLDSAGYNNLTLSYASRVSSGSSATEAWTYSLDGVHFTALTSLSPTAGTFGALSLNLSTLSSGALNNQSVFYLRETTTSAASSYAFDNIQLNGVAVVPEPSTYALMGVGMLGLVFILRRKRML